MNSFEHSPNYYLFNSELSKLKLIDCINYERSTGRATLSCDEEDMEISFSKLPYELNGFVNFNLNDFLLDETYICDDNFNDYCQYCIELMN